MPSGKDAESTSNRWKILLADDDRDSRLVLSTLFEFEGFDVLHAVDGLAAVEIARERRPDVVVLNLFMPRLSGHQVLQALRADEDTASMPCLLLTGDARLEQMGRALRNGADGYVTKPVAPRAVVRLVRRLLEEPRSP